VRANTNGEQKQANSIQGQTKLRNGCSANSSVELGGTNILVHYPLSTHAMRGSNNKFIKQLLAWSCCSARYTRTPCKVKIKQYETPP